MDISSVPETAVEECLEVDIDKPLGNDEEEEEEGV